MVTSMPSGQWSCATLEEGVQLAAQTAGLTLNDIDMGKARAVQQPLW